MPEQLTDYFTADTYTPEGTIGPAGQARQLRFSGYNKAFVVQLAVRQPGPAPRSGNGAFTVDEYVYAPNSGDTFGSEVVGARFRSYDPGESAEIYATLAYDGEPLAADAPPFNPSAAPTPGSPYRIVMQNHHVCGAGPAALHTSEPLSAIILRADPTNAGIVYVGNSTLNVSPDGYWLSPGNRVAFSIGNAKDVYLLADVPGDGVSWMGIG